MKSIIAGDWHGNLRAAVSVIDDAVTDRCKRVFQVGDFGVPFNSDPWYFDKISEYAVQKGVKVYFIDGNHENFNLIEEWVEHFDRDENGHILICDNLYYIPRGTVWEDEDGLTYAVMGGAASVDRQWRAKGYDWFEEEMITPQDVLNLHTNIAGRKIDVFLTHDCSDDTPWGFVLIPDPQSYLNRKVIDALLETINPTLHFHGHMHKHFEWVFTAKNGKKTQVHGLNMENERHSRGILDSETLTFESIPYHGVIDPLDPIFQW